MPLLEECLLRQLLTAVEGFVVSVPYLTEVPATATSEGTAGQIAFNTTHLYICVADDVWRRVAISSW